MRKSILIASVAWVASITLAHAADAPKVSVVPVISTNTTVTGQKIVVPADPTVAVSIATFPPGARLPVHKHLYPHYAYVLEGTLTVHNEETGKTFDVKQGEFLVEMNDTWHYGVNNGAVPVKLLVIDHLPAGVTTNVVPKEKP